MNRHLTLARPDVEKLVGSDEFAFVWELAKTLAPLSPEMARQDIATNWDYITQRCDLKTLLDTIAHIRLSAVNRFVDRETITRAVERHLDLL